MRVLSWSTMSLAVALANIIACGSASNDNPGSGVASKPSVPGGGAGSSGAMSASAASTASATGVGAGGRNAATPAAGSGGATRTGQAQPVAGSAANGGTGGSGAGGKSGSSGASGNAGSSDLAAGDGAGGAGGAADPSNTGTLPPVTDLDMFGPFTPVIVESTGPNDAYRLDHPNELGDNGIKHPAVVFVAGGGSPENYGTLLQYLASQGFVVLSYAATDDQGQEIHDGIDWLIAQNTAASGLLAGKLDTDHIAAAGHSFGSLAVFNAASDERITTTVHLSGGTLDPHSEVANLRAPAEFICGESPTGDQDGTWTGDMANPNCEIDFDKATVPVFYGSLKGAAHVQLTDALDDVSDPLRLQMLGAIGGYLRWRLAGDESQHARYVGDDCGLCQPSTGWTIKQKGLM